MNIIGAMSVESIGESYCKNYKKLDCDHKVIYLDNWE